MGERIRVTAGLFGDGRSRGRKNDERRAVDDRVLLSLLGSLLRGQLGLADGCFIGGLRLLHGHLIGLLRGLSGLLGGVLCGREGGERKRESKNREELVSHGVYPHL